MVELILVIVLIGILSAIAVVKWIDLSNSAKTATCIANQMTLETAQMMYYAQHNINGVPGYAHELDELLPYLKDPEMPKCPEPNGQLQILSSGAITCILNSHKRAGTRMP